MENILVVIMGIVALIGVADVAGERIGRFILRRAVRRIQKRLTRVEPPEQPEDWHEEPLGEDDCECIPEYPMRVYFKPAWIELVLRDIQRADKAKWN